MLTAWRQIYNTPTYVTPSSFTCRYILLLFRCAPGKVKLRQDRREAPFRHLTSEKARWERRRSLNVCTCRRREWAAKKISWFIHFTFSSAFIPLLLFSLSRVIVLSRPLLNSSTFPAHTIKTWKPRETKSFPGVNAHVSIYYNVFTRTRAVRRALVNNCNRHNNIM